MLTDEQQATILHDAATAIGMGGHVQTGGNTAAERVMQMFGGKRNTPRKMSYLYCDSVDACFYFQNDIAYCTFTAKWHAGARDLDRLQPAASYIKDMLGEVQVMAAAVLESKDGGDSDA